MVIALVTGIALMRAIGALEGLSAVFAAAAAVFWFLSTRVDLSVITSTYGDMGNSAEFYAVFMRVATLNKRAAACAGVSALLQAIALVL